MTLDRDELALKAALDRRRPAGLPPELLVRLDAIPGEVPVRRPLPMRLAIGLAPWAALVALLLLAVALPSAGSAIRVGTSAPPAGSWDPTTTGGEAATGVFSLPWIPLGLWLSLFVIAAAVLRIRAGVPLEGPRSWAGWARRNLAWKSRPPMRVRLAFWLAWVVPFVLMMVQGDWDPLAYAQPGGPGIGFYEERSGGSWQYDGSEHKSTLETYPNCETMCDGPRYVYRVAPNELMTLVVSVENASILPVTLLGLPESDSTPYGLALLRDPASASSDPSNLLPFQPTFLAPGQAVTVAIVTSGWSCADPTAQTSSAQVGMQSWPLIYDVFGWRREGNVWPHFSIDLLGC